MFNHYEDSADPIMKTLIISSGFIADIPHRNPDLSVVSLGDELRLEPEPSNAYDPQAVKIIHAASGQFLGYVPREQTEAIHLALSEGFMLIANVSVSQHQVKWKEVGYSVTVSFEQAN